MDKSTQVMAAVGLLGLTLILIIFAPLFALWGWNQLFGDIKTLEYSFWNWLAVIGLSAVFKNFAVSRNK